MRITKLLSVFLCIAMLVGMFPMIITTSAATPTITLSPSTIEPGNTVFDVICENTDAKDWICVYHSSQTIGKNQHSGWQLAPVGGGTVTFSTEFFNSADHYLKRTINTPGGWPLQEGEWTIVLFDNDTYTEILDQKVLTVKAAPIVGAVYVSNKYGSDSNDGLTEDTPVKTLAQAVSIIGTTHDGTVVVLDGKDKDGNAEYEVYTRSSTSPYTYGGEQNVLQYINVPAHTGTITYVGDAADSVICYGMNHFELKGPSVFKNITLIEGYNTAKNFITYGHDVTFEGNVTLLKTKKTGAGTAANAGVSSAGNIDLDVSGRYKITDNGTVSLLSGKFGEVALGGWDNNISVEGDQTIYVDGATVNNIKLRNSSGSWTMKNLAVVVDSGTVGKINDGGTGTCSAESVQIIINNGVSVPYTPTTISFSKGAWFLKAEADESGAKLALTDTVGDFEVIGDKVAVAVSTSGVTYASQDGILTVPAGDYSVTWTDELLGDQIIVKYDGKVDPGYYVKGTEITLPTLSSNPAGTFVGWTIDGVSYAAGESYLLPTDVEEIDIVSVWEKNADTIVVYVDAENGADTNSGATELAPFASIKAAIAAVDAAEQPKKYVMLIGEHKINATLGEHENMIIISGGTVTISEESVEIGGPTTFENVTINLMKSSKFIESVGHELIMGEGMKFTSNSTSITGTYFHIGTYDSDGGREKFVHNSGVTRNIYVGAYYNREQRHTTDGADIIINGGSVSYIRLGADGWGGGPIYGTDFIGDVNLTFNGGSVKNINLFEGTYAPTFGAAVQFVMNNGITVTPPEITATDGVWIMRGEAREGSSLSTTDKAGEYKVNGDFTAVATSKDGQTIYISASGYLSVPVAGEYTVTYTDKVYYTNTGTEIEFFDDYTIDFDNLRHDEIDGKLFIGWVDENGEGVTSTEFKAGDKIFAEYVDCNLEDGGDFFIKGVQVRTMAPAGLRFVVEKTDALHEALDAVEYGSVIVPTEVMGSKQLYIDEVYTLNDKQYEAKTVEGVKTFKNTDDGIQYTVCVINISEDLYRRNYTVRGYIKYTDLNGTPRVLYTDSYATNIYAVAKEALKDSSISDSDRQYLATIKNYVDETLKQEYLNQPKTDIVGSSADPKTWKYQLGNGVMVREVEIDTGKGGDPVEIVQVTDTHFNYCTEEDLKDPVLASTWENRRAFKYPTTQTALLNSFEYAGYSDQIVVTGDAIDYLSQGCLELLFTYLWNPYPDALIALGNHDIVKKMQGKVEDPSTYEDRYEILKGVWKHDIFYTEKILKNDDGVEMVMVIQMDNSRILYQDEQVTKFKASLATAREKDIPILIFSHVPFLTRNPEDADMRSFYVNDPTSDPVNLYNDRNFVGLATSGATKEMYDLVTMNPDVVKGIFTGHWHADFYSEVWSKNADGTDNPDVVIPQYLLTGSAYDKGHALRITVK